MLLITHELAGLGYFDEIVVLDAGHVLERGSHERLLATGGLYAGLWQDRVEAPARPQPRASVSNRADPARSRAYVGA